MEGDDDSASDGEDGLSCLARKQAAGTLEEYEEDSQQLPGDNDDGTNEGEDELTSDDIDLIHNAEQLALAIDSESKDKDMSGESSDEDDMGDDDFIPILKWKGKNKPKGFKAMGGKKCMPKVKQDANYTFCPLSHQISILCLISKHFCQHSILPERHGQRQSPEQIHRDAVLETYYHCRANNLHEVWGYLWTNWYALSKWELWAQSSYEGAIPRKRTTMLVELLWQNFKRLVLYQYNRPHVNFATYALVTQGIPLYRLWFNQIVNDPRDGRARFLCSEQAAIRNLWLILAKRKSEGSYITDVNLWLCDCRTQKYNSYLLCKHLVQLLPLPNADWWATVVWRHTPPFYDIQELLPEAERASAPIPTALSSQYWDKQDSPLLQDSTPLTALQNFVSIINGPHLMTEWLAGQLSSKGT